MLTWKTMSPPSSMTAGRMRVSSSSLIMATTSLSSSEIAVLEVCAAGSVNSGSPALADELPQESFFSVSLSSSTVHAEEPSTSPSHIPQVLGHSEDIMACPGPGPGSGSGSPSHAP